eukprot:PhM_4_TR429/c0_g1_i1/m.71371
MDEGVARDACLALVGLREAAVDDHEAAVSLHRDFALLHFNGRVAVDDAPRLRAPKLTQNLATHIRVHAVSVVRVSGLLVRCLVGDKVALEGRHAGLAEERGRGTSPQEVERVKPGTALVAVLRGVPALTGELVEAVDVRLAAELRVANAELTEVALLVHRDAAVEQQRAVERLVHAAVVEEELNVLVQTDAVAELTQEGLDDALLRLGELVRVLRIKRREVLVQQRVCLAVDLDRARLEVHRGEHDTVVHRELRVPLDELSLQLKLDDAQGLVHFGVECKVRGGEVALAGLLRLEGTAGVVAVRVHGVGRQGKQADAIAFLNRTQVSVAKGNTESTAQGHLAAGTRTHPQDVMVAPLEINRFEVREVVHDDVSAWAAVENIADNVEAVDGEIADHSGERDDHVRRTAGLDDSRENVLKVLLARRIAHRMDELFDEELMSRGHCLADLLPSVLGRDLAEHHKDVLEVVHAPRVPLENNALERQLQTLFRVIDERREFIHFELREFVGEELVDVAADDTAAVVHDVEEGLVLSVDVGHEMLRALWELQHRLQVDNLSRGGVDVGKQL